MPVEDWMPGPPAVPELAVLFFDEEIKEAAKSLAKECDL
jgi:hypothetical protein